MKVLFIGGTGNISTEVSKLAVARGIDLYHINRGHTQVNIEGVYSTVANIHQPEQVREAIANQFFDVIVNWVAFTPADIERDIELFTGKCNQYIFISSASAYQKPPNHPVITEGTPLVNPHMEYSRNKIACEERLMQAHRENNFPVTIVRPSHTYDTILPTSIGNGNSYVIPRRMLDGRPVVVHGDGTSIWTLTHSADFAKGFVGLLGNPQTIGHAFTITSDYLLTWNQIYEQMGQALGVTPNIVHIPSDFIAEYDFHTGETLLGDKAHSVIFDNSKLKQFVPDYVATIPFYEGVRRTLAWFQAEESRLQVPDEDHAFLDNLIDRYKHAD